MFTTGFLGRWFLWESQLFSVESQVSRKTGRGDPSQAKTLAKDPAKELTQSICLFCDLSVPWWQKKKKKSLSTVEVPIH